MKTGRKFLAGILLWLGLAGHLFAQLQITSFQQGGFLSFSNTTSNTFFNVEWASSVTGTYFRNWNRLEERTFTSSVMTVQIPLFFRVRVDTSEWITVSGPHNIPDPVTGLGTVNYPYRIGKFEVSNAQYARFLNAVDPVGYNSSNLFNTSMATSPRGGITNDNNLAEGSRYQVKTNMFNKPVLYVSFWDACRYVNWLHNDQGRGGTESGAYDLDALAPLNARVSRNPAARYFLPNENEWYKAAYYDPGRSPVPYWLYPTRSDTVPTVARVDAFGNITNDTAFIANYNNGAVWNGASGNVSAFGSGGSGGESASSVADMGGNAMEWIEDVDATSFRMARGGSYFSIGNVLRSLDSSALDPGTDFSSVGFRVARPVLP